MPVPVKACPFCKKLMWVTDESIEWIDETTFRFPCPHCRALVRRRLVEVGANAAGPIQPG
jgi:hypothetical protein